LYSSNILPKGIKMQFKKFAFFAILAALLFSGCTDSKPSGKNDKKVPEIQRVFLTTTQAKVLSTQLEKDVFTIKELKGKAVLVNFFATWCPPCKAEIPHLNNLKAKYKDQFEIVAVLLEENKSASELQDFIDQYNIDYLVTNSKENFKLADVMGGVKSIPTMFMYNKEGQLIQKYVGIVPEEMLESDIKRAIK
jgi:thiol-disulfide isomerase/thioredoxin